LVVAKEPKGDTHYRFVSGEVAAVAGDDVHAGTSCVANCAQNACS
jgi:hypothetical protein